MVMSSLGAGDAVDGLFTYLYVCFYMFNAFSFFERY